MARFPTKKTKDPNAPKKGLSAYFHWLKENRGRVQKDNSTLKPTEIVKKCAEEWTSLADKDKTKWHAMAADDKIRYLKELESYKGKEEKKE
ncbi:unnamed protein product [Auanema sp. JU1783]|nr:unnamed protein product [Auanema sp. JU1783]